MNASALSPSNQQLADALETELVPFIDQVMEGYGLAGTGIGIVSKGEIIFARGFGKRNVDTGEPVTARSLFHLASVSKTFVATAIMQLWEDGRLDLDAPVTTYLPYFSLKGEGVDQITIRRMLSHTSGMPDTDDTTWRHLQFDDGALERFVRSLADEEMVATPGEGFVYSNAAYEVLGDVIAKVSGQTFEAYVKEGILEPLGMHDSTFLRSEVDPALATTPHFGAPLMVLGDAYPYNRANAPSSSIHSSAADMCRWMLANLALGTLDGRRILEEVTYDTMWHPMALATNDDEPTDKEICLGWFRGAYREEPTRHHGGADPGYWADLYLLPEREMGMVATSNVYCASAWSVADAAMDIMLGLAPTKPKRPVTVPVGAVLKSSGQDAAIAEYRRLQFAAPDEYDFDEHHFSHTTGSAVWLHRPDAVMPLLHLRTALFPESSEAYEELGEAYLIGGDMAAAERNLQTALALDPESESIPKLMQRLESA